MAFVRGEHPGAAEVDPQNAYLSQGVKIEPLVDRWYAWPHLLAPAQQALNLAYRYLPTVRSFVASPEVHAAAATDPSMFGGPFLALPVSRLAAVMEYLAETEGLRAEALEFARDFREFDLQLQQASGYSLDVYRKQVPNSLRGLIEIVYDLNSHPKIRLIEEMFLDNDLGHKTSQELRLHRQADTSREFFLSTPRLPDEDAIFLKTSFASEVSKDLYRSRRNVINVLDLARRVGIDAEVLLPWFGDAPNPFGDRYQGAGVRVRYFGHACILIESKNTSILVDPTFAQESAEDNQFFSIDDIPASIDVLFISHGHQDHLTPEMLLHLVDRVDTVLIPRHNAGDLADPSLKMMLLNLGFKSIVTLDPLDSHELYDGRITSLPFTGEHCDLDVHSKQCGLIEIQGKRIALFVDSDAIDPDVYMRLRSRLQAADLLFLGMECFGAPLTWLYGPLRSTRITRRDDESRRMSGANRLQAWALVEKLKPKAIYVYAMGQEPWMRPLMGLNYTEESIQIKESSEFVAQCRASSIPSECLYLKMECVI